MNKLDLIAIRDGEPGDKNFILATWLRGLRYGNDWFGAIEPSVYFSVYQKIIEVVLANPLVTIRVACLKEDKDVILGYAVYSGNRLDWIFCKKIWRGIGLTKILVPSQITVVSHLTALGKSILKKHPGVYFNPFSIS